MAKTNHRFTEAGPNMPFGTAPAPLVFAPLFYSICMWCAYSAYRPFVPAEVLNAWLIVQMGWIIFWISTNAICSFLPSNALQRGKWFDRIGGFIEIGTLIGALSVLWVFFPYGDDDIRFANIVCEMAYVSVAILINPEVRFMNRFICISVSGSMILLMYIFRVPYWPFLTLVLISFGAVIYVLSRVFEHSVSAIRHVGELAERQLDARTRFLASASHDLGQPLQAARLFFDQANRGASDSQRAAAYRNADNALSAMDRQLRYMLDYVRLTSQAVTARAEHARLDRILGSVFAQFEPVAELAGVTMQTAETSRSAWIDAGLLERALGNLIDNALRHADASRLLIGVHGNRIWVIDNGRGVPAEERSQLFAEFTQGRRHQTRERGGFGLGLASTHRLMELMGGNAGHEARWVNGSAFFLEMPRHAIVTIPP